MNKEIKILIVEDDGFAQALMSEMLTHLCEEKGLVPKIFTTTTCPESLKVADEHPEIALIFLDASLDREQRLDTCELARQLVQLCPYSFRVATSSDWRNNYRLMAAGCHVPFLKPSMILEVWMVATLTMAIAQMPPK